MHVYQASGMQIAAAGPEGGSGWTQVVPIDRARSAYQGTIIASAHLAATSQRGHEGFTDLEPALKI